MPRAMFDAASSRAGWAAERAPSRSAMHTAVTRPSGRRRDPPFCIALGPRVAQAMRRSRDSHPEKWTLAVVGRSISHRVVAPSDNSSLESRRALQILKLTHGASTHLGRGLMKFRSALLLGALLAVISPGLAFGQGFQGGLRGSIKDSGGVVPGVD